jgi:hypothetical protein
MKYIVKEVNILTNTTIATHEFNNEADAFDYAWQMNEAMQATPIRYKFCN